jgi:hypothetical protein
MTRSLEVRKVSDNLWKVFHIPTGLPIGHKNSMSYGRNKKKDVIAFMQYLSIFPWHEWKDISNKPSWANDAWQHIQAYGDDLPTNRFHAFVARENFI